MWQQQWALFLSSDPCLVCTLLKSAKPFHMGLFPFSQFQGTSVLEQVKPFTQLKLSASPAKLGSRSTLRRPGILAALDLSFPNSLPGHALGHTCFILAKQLQQKSQIQRKPTGFDFLSLLNSNWMLQFYTLCHSRVRCKSLPLESRCTCDCFDKNFGRSDPMWFQR